MGDGGSIFCGAHAGATARYSGRDLSGQPVMEITPAMLPAWRREIAAIGGDPAEHAPACEGCGRTVAGWEA
jgi:hypothetical protein